MVHSTLRALLVAALLVTAGCQAPLGSSAPPSDDRAVAAVDRAREATGGVTSYRFTVDGEVRIREAGRTESVGIRGSGVVDVANRRANETVVARGDTGPMVRDTRMAYVEGYTLDVECARLGWARYDLAESTRWVEYTTLGQQLALLDRTTVYWNGTETVDGTEVAVVTARPTEQQLEAARDLPTGGGVTQGGASVRNATVRVLIDADTGRIREVRRELHVGAGEATAVATVTYRFADYDAPTNVTRPGFEESGARWESGCPSA
jgi:hypothetical protein